MEKPPTIILALETSSSRGSVAMEGPGGILEEFLPEGVPHSETLIPGVEALLSRAGRIRREVTGLAVGRGPGAFTGLRVGLATAQGWARARGLPLAGVSSLDALAWPRRGEGRPVLACVDARKGEVYAALFRGEISGRGLFPLVGPVLLKPGEVPGWAGGFLARLPGPAGGTLIVGTGAPLVREAAGSAGAFSFPGGDPFPLASSVLALGRGLFEEGKGTGPGGLEPLYVRPPDARKPG